MCFHSSPGTFRSCPQSKSSHEDRGPGRHEHRRNQLFVVLSLRSGDNVPILTEGVSSYAHPVPQAVIVTAIVIGFAILAISLVYATILVQRLRSVDTERLEEESGG